MKKKQYKTPNEALEGMLKDPKIMNKIFKSMKAKQTKKDKNTDKWKKKFDKMDDTKFTEYVTLIGKEYNENPYHKETIPYKYVEEMWAIVHVMEKYGVESPFPEDDNKYGFGQGYWTYRGFTLELFVGQGSFFSISKDGKNIGSTWC
jgi:hypothetical protein